MAAITRARSGLGPLDWVSNLPLFPFLSPGIRVEEYFEGDTFIVRAELPGVDPAKDVNVTFADGELRLHVERKSEERDKTHSEFHYGSFYRVIPLPAGVREDTITADYANGILTIKMLVGEGSGGKTIPISIEAGKS